MRSNPIVLLLAIPISALGQSVPHLGVAVDVSSLGVGFGVATGVTQHSNLRFGFNAFSYSATANKDGISYPGTLTLRSARILYDQYIVGPFHISPGVMIYDGNRGKATPSIPAGQAFTLGGVTWYSQAGNPISGTAEITARKVAPMILLGFGNLLPRNSRHLTLNLDFGVVFQGSPKAALNLTGGACITPAGGCLSATDPVVRANIQTEQSRINNSLSPFEYFPVISLSFGYKF